MNTLNALSQQLLARLQADEGQTMVEYGLILALVSVVAIAILTTLGGSIQTTFSSASSAL
jgi:pilus assembly protein Flp/PilA